MTALPDARVRGLVLLALLLASAGLALGAALAGQAAAARASRVAALSRAIAAAERDCATLRLRAVIRARPDELGRWTAPLALSAPRAHQYLPDLRALDGLGRPAGDGPARPSPAPVAG